MTSVKRLDASTARLLSSGQVITDVKSVVKELVENSLDAGSTQVDVVLENGGWDKIVVSDNGRGISHEDAKLMCKRGCTSKIAAFEDLQALTTLGFRGEALGSLCTVAQVCVETMTEDDRVGMQYTVDGMGTIQSSKPAALNGHGTSITVTSLFNALPVRRKEGSHPNKIKASLQTIQTLLYGYALAYPHVAFSFRNTRPVPLAWKKPALTAAKDVAASLFGLPLARSLRPLAYESAANPVRITGLLPLDSANPDTVTRSANDRCFVFVNKRPVTLGFLHKLMREYCTPVKLKGNYPVLFLDITMPPQMLDVNVTADKTKVFLQQEDGIVDILTGILQDMYATPIERFVGKTPGASASAKAVRFSEEAPEMLGEDGDVDMHTDDGEERHGEAGEAPSMDEPFVSSSSSSISSSSSSSSFPKATQLTPTSSAPSSSLKITATTLYSTYGDDIGGSPALSRTPSTLSPSTLSPASALLSPFGSPPVPVHVSGATVGLSSLKTVAQLAEELRDSLDPAPSPLPSPSPSPSPLPSPSSLPSPQPMASSQEHLGVIDIRNISTTLRARPSSSQAGSQASPAPSPSSSSASSPSSVPRGVNPYKKTSSPSISATSATAISPLSPHAAPAPAAAVSGAASSKRTHPTLLADDGGAPPVKKGSAAAGGGGTVGGASSVGGAQPKKPSTSTAASKRTAPSSSKQAQPPAVVSLVTKPIKVPFSLWYVTPSTASTPSSSASGASVAASSSKFAALGDVNVTLKMCANASVVGRLPSAPHWWVLRYGDALLAFNALGARQRVLFGQMCGEAVLATAPLASHKPLTPSSLGSDAAFAQLSTLDSRPVMTLGARTIHMLTDRRLHSNGFEVRKFVERREQDSGSDEEATVTYALTAVCTVIPGYGVQDLAELLVSMGSRERVSGMLVRPARALEHFRAQVRGASPGVLSGSAGGKVADAIAQLCALPDANLGQGVEDMEGRPLCVPLALLSQGCRV